ncbi:MAG: ABC transporter permease [Acidobacteria bacterium]|nr:ABC transporter permease [Acidobacteriota bacterium]
MRRGRWLRRLLGVPEHPDPDLSEEFETYLELRAAEFAKEGMTGDEAMRAARAVFGDAERIQKECVEVVRRSTFWDSLLKDLGYGVRMLTRSPGFTTVAVLSLALGIGATSTIFSVLNAAVLRPLPFREPDRLVFIQEFDPEGGREGRPRAPTFLAWREQNQTFEQMALGEGTSGGARVVSATGETERFPRRNVGADIFRLLGVQAILGRTFAAEDFAESFRSSTVVISFGLWQQLFGGDPAALGQELTLGNGTTTIVGVMPPGFWIRPQTGNRAWVWVGNDLTQASLRELQNEGRYSQVLGRLKSGVSVEQAQADLQTISRGLEMDAGTEDTPWRVQVEPLAQVLSGTYAGTLYVLFGAVGCVLLIACLNVATLSLGRAAARRKEIATRLALGAGRLRVMRQLLTESMLLALLGGVLGVGLAVVGIKLFIALAAGWYPPTDEIQVDGTVLGFTVGLSLLVGIVSGVAPALRSSAVNLTDSLKAGARGTPGGAGHRISDVLVVSQAALALVLLVGAGLMLNSFVRLVRVDPGFQSDHLLTMRFNLLGAGEIFNLDVVRFTPRTALVQQQLLERIETLPEVDSVGLVSGLDLWYDVTHLGRPAAARQEPFEAGYAEISPDYFRTLQIPLLKGRVFTARDGAGAPGVAIINETMARQFFPGEDPLGARVQADLIRAFVHEDLIDDQPRTIVGVVGDVKRRLRSEIGPLMYVPYGQHMDVYPFFSARVPALKRLVIRTAADPLSLAGAVTTAMADVDPDLAPRLIRTMDAGLAGSAWQEKFWLQLLGLFAGLAVALAAMGFYGVISYAVADRTHELGIRTALGAKRTDVFTMIVRRGLVLALLGVAIGIPAALALTGVIASRLFGVTPTDPATLAAAAAMFVSIALLACSIPARRATKVDPMVALRSE